MIDVHTALVSPQPVTTMWGLTRSPSLTMCSGCMSRDSEMRKSTTGSTSRRSLPSIRYCWSSGNVNSSGAVARLLHPDYALLRRTLTVRFASFADTHGHGHLVRTVDQALKYIISMGVVPPLELR